MVGKRAKKWPKITKSSVCFTLYLRNLHHMIVILVHMCKMIISPANFFIFQNFDFSGVFRGVKGQKMTYNYQFQYVMFYISGTVEHIKILIMTSTGVFHHFLKKRCNILNIKIILFFVGPLQQFF